MSTKTHGLSRSPEYRAWASMKNRCYNPKNCSYNYYGDRGITVCDRWRNSFAAFYEDMGARPKGLTLDRKDNDGNYEPSNCRWATRQEQGRNSRHNHIIEFNGKRQCVAAWAEELGLQYGSLMVRLQYLSVEEALGKKKQKGGYKRKSDTI